VGKFGRCAVARGLYQTFMLITTSSDEIEELKELLRRLRQADEKLRVSGAEYHKYRLRPTLTEAELQQFEQTHQVKLPEITVCS
jgi:cell shape-determining protein MreC